MKDATKSRDDLRKQMNDTISEVTFINFCRTQPIGRDELVNVRLISEGKLIKL